MGGKCPETRKAHEKASFHCYKELKPNGQPAPSTHDGTNGTNVVRTVLEETDTIEKTYRSICLIQTCEDIPNMTTSRTRRCRRDDMIDAPMACTPITSTTFEIPEPVCRAQSVSE
uniref:Uncharacterized protein n=1 Tax=Anopheles melas TaxID=34690 RepID=A0A182TLL6_9DIPT